MNNAITPAVLCAVYASACAAGGALSVLYNRLPAHWFCDYGEKPGDIHMGNRLPQHHGRLAAALLSGLSAVLLFAVLGFGIRFFLCWIFCVIAEFIAFADMKFSIIPDQLVLSAATAAVLLTVNECVVKNSAVPVLLSLGGGACGAALIILLNLFGKLARRQDVMGMGDAKLFAAVGLAVGFPAVLRVFFLTIMLAGICFALLFAVKRLKTGEYRPLGPFICLAAACEICFGEYLDRLTSLYVSLLK